jgi:hypothetical protein
MAGFGSVPNTECEDEISVDLKSRQLMGSVFIDAGP